MTGPHEVYISDGHGILTKLTPRLAAEAMASFWEDYKHDERHHMSWQNGSTAHPGQDMDGHRCRIYLTGEDGPIDGTVHLLTTPFIKVTQRRNGADDINLNTLQIRHWTTIDQT